MILLQGVRASVRPDEAQRKVKEWQENFKAYQNALQRLSVSSSADTSVARLSIPPQQAVSLVREKNQMHTAV